MTCVGNVSHKLQDGVICLKPVVFQYKTYTLVFIKNKLGSFCHVMEQLW